MKLDSTRSIGVSQTPFGYQALVSDPEGNMIRVNGNFDTELEALQFADNMQAHSRQVALYTAA